MPVSIRTRPSESGDSIVRRCRLIVDSSAESDSVRRCRAFRRCGLDGYGWRSDGRIAATLLRRRSTACTCAHARVRATMPQRYSVRTGIPIRRGAADIIQGIDFGVDEARWEGVGWQEFDEMIKVDVVNAFFAPEIVFHSNADASLVPAREEKKLNSRKGLYKVDSCLLFNNITRLSLTLRSLLFLIFLAQWKKL